MMLQSLLSHKKYIYDGAIIVGGLVVYHNIWQYFTKFGDPGSVATKYQKSGLDHLYGRVNTEELKQSLTSIKKRATLANHFYDLTGCIMCFCVSKLAKNDFRKKCILYPFSGAACYTAFRISHSFYKDAKYAETHLKRISNS